MRDARRGTTRAAIRQYEIATLTAVPGQGRQRIVEGRHTLDREVAGVLTCVSQLGGRHEEQIDSGLPGSRHLLDDPPDRTNVAPDVDRAGRGHPQATGQLPRGDQVQDRQRQGQSGRVSANPPRVHQHVHRKIVHVLPTRLGYDAQEADGRIVLPLTERHLDHPRRSAPDRLHLQPYDLTGDPAPDRMHQVNRLADLDPIHRQDHVVDGQQPGRGADHLRHAHPGRLDRVDAEVAEGHGDRRRLRHPHQPHVEGPVLVTAPAAQHLVLPDQGEGSLQPRLEVLPAVHGGVLADRREVHLAHRIEPLATGDDHPLAEGLDGTRPEHEVREPDKRQQQRRRHGDEHEGADPPPAGGATAGV
jgi:hypothetical protein